MFISITAGMQIRIVHKHKFKLNVVTSTMPKNMPPNTYLITDTAYYLGVTLIQYSLELFITCPAKSTEKLMDYLVAPFKVFW